VCSSLCAELDQIGPSRRGLRSAFACPITIAEGRIKAFLENGFEAIDVDEFDLFWVGDRYEQEARDAHRRRHASQNHGLRLRVGQILEGALLQPVSHLGALSHQLADRLAPITADHNIFYSFGGIVPHVAKVEPETFFGETEADNVSCPIGQQGCKTDSAGDQLVPVFRGASGDVVFVAPVKDQKFSDLFEAEQPVEWSDRRIRFSSSVRTAPADLYA